MSSTQTLKPWQALRRSLGLVAQSAPHELRGIVLCNLISGVGPALSLFLSKVIIDEITHLVRQYSSLSDGWELLLDQPRLLGSLVLMLGCNLVVESISAIDGPMFAALRDRIQGATESRVLAKIATFNDIALFENPELLNIVQLTEQGIQRIQRLALIIAGSLMGVFTLIPSVFLAATIAWWVPPLLLLLTGPSVLVEMRHWRKSWRVEKTLAGLWRQREIYQKLLKEESYAKEIRLFSLQSVLLGRWQALFDEMAQAMRAVRREGAIATIFWSTLSGFGAAIPYLYVITGVLQRQFTLGDIALYTGLILQLRRSLYQLIGNLGEIYDVALATGPIFQLFDLQPQILSPAHAAPGPRTPGSGLQIRDLSFQYPGSDRPIVRNLNLTIQPGEMVVLVGENGAGKTTLGKLLCRLYDPTLGSIEWHGQDLRELNLDELRSRIAVVMQDYARFPASVRENVGWGYLPKLNEDLAIETALEEAGLKPVLLKLEKGLDTPLGKQLEDGIDLSGGQWQRLAIARALLRLGSAELLIFDEPTAALDPKNEHEIYNIFRAIARGRMAVVISHRLSLARMADRIVVLEHGEILEEGTHDALMVQGGRYAEMFTRQASSYVSEEEAEKPHE